MLNHQQSDFNLVNKGYEAFKKLRKLELIESEVYLCEFELEDNSFFKSFISENQAEYTNERHLQIRKLVFLTDLIIEILNRTENFCKINIIFNELNHYNSLAFYENILAYFYSMVSIRCKHLENKKFIITFPQIFSNKFKECLKKKDLTNFNYQKNFNELLGNYKINKLLIHL